jgi:hypothetical protein
MTRLTLSDFAETIDCQLKRVAVVATSRREFFFCAHCQATVIRPAGTERAPCPVAELVALDLKQRDPPSPEGGLRRTGARPS